MTRIQHISYSGLAPDRFLIQKRFLFFWLTVWSSHDKPLEFTSREAAEKWMENPDYRL